MSHEFHVVYSESMKEYGEKELKLIDDTLNFGYKIIQTIGIIAGFGFTAIGYVKNIYLFVLGEGVLFCSIIFGVNKIRQIYSNNLNSIQSFGAKIGAIFKEKSDIFQEAILGTVKNRMINLITFENKIAIVDQKFLKIFEPNKKSKTKKNEDFLTPLILFLILGGIFLLNSFL